jgi:uncharacterized protein (TIGR00725 family)
MTTKKRFVAIIGGSQCTTQEAKLAKEIGRELAKRGAVLVCGGLGGIMEAACKGASLEGGLTIGILPGSNRQAANSYVQIPIVTNLGEARNVVIVKSAEAVIAIGGGYGTLSEIGHALRNGLPIVGLNTWRLSRNDQPNTSIIYVQNPIEAVDLALSLIIDQ